MGLKNITSRAVVVAQLVEWSLPTPEVSDSNPVMGKLLYQTLNCLPTVNCIETTKINKKRPRMAHFLRILHPIFKSIRNFVKISPAKFLESRSTSDADKKMYCLIFTLVAYQRNILENGI